MTKTDRIRYEMYLRVRDFGITHRETFPTASVGGQAFATIARVVDDIEAHAPARLLAAQQGRKTRTEARQAVRRWMQTIATTARHIRRTTPGLDSLEMPRSRSDATLLGAAEAFLTDTAPFRKELVAFGLPANFLTELRHAVSVFTDAQAKRRAGGAGLSSARAGIAAAFREGASAIRALDVVIPNTIGSNPVLMAAWRRDRRVVRGAAKGKANPVVLPTGAAQSPSAAPAVSVDTAPPESPDSPASDVESPRSDTALVLVPAADLDKAS